MSALEQATRDAVDWLLLLERLPAEDAAHAGFRQWLAQAPVHQAAWQRVNGLMAAPLADLQTTGQLHLAGRALRQSAQLSRRRVLGGGLAAVLLTLGSAAWVNRLMPLEHAFADLRTGTGERRRFTLADGSRVQLDARSALDVHLDASSRQLKLLTGAMLLEAADAPAQPMRVRCRDGLLQCNGATLLLRQQAAATLLSVQRGRVLLAAGQGASFEVQAGQVVRFDRQGVAAQAVSLWSRSTWTEGHLDVRDEPLGDVVEALRAYHPGLLRISPQAARLRVYGSFPLGEVDRTLQALAETLPITLQRSGFWLTRIEVHNG
ncbi:MULTISPECIES: FecR domain-containing protein [Pseudomonas]|uniref:Transmembrane sensor n=1 Tax=Pseudomonas hunanensis TaxID=1247546 RepID=A0ACC6K4Z0_9PSED|nr:MULTISPECIES: FecR domain-containing protein [Pseudomonas]MBP2260443.1 transmembrane sensor [Pseudomonas sp. BP8]MDR6713550.1 transmembrane sensor [Pseudomonas hunanensis]HDS1736498.1 FecR domain-containing protein [Pseudomonas putida]